MRTRSLSRGKRIVSYLLALLLAVGVFHVVMPAQKAEAAVTGAPENSKQLIDNGDGTYTLALSVTGATESSTVSQVTKANVILVADTSSSMNQSSGSTTPFEYTEYTGDGQPGPGNVYWGGPDEEGEYFRVYWRGGPNGGWRTGDAPNAPVYDGTVYTRSGGNDISRLEAEKDALTKDGGIIDNLLAQNVAGDPNKSDIIEVAVANFGRTGTTAQTFTTDGDSLKNTINGLTTSTGTNWEEGLMRAKELADTIKASQTNEDVYVIFLTDGEPTTDHTRPENQRYNVNTNFAQEWGYASDDARGLITAGYTFYGLFTWGSGDRSHFLSSLVQFAYTGSGDSDSALQPAYQDYFTDASDTATLIEALNQIVHDITNSVGYTNVELEDGVTSMTTSNIKATPGGEVTGLKYYRSGGSYSTTANDGLGDEWTDAPKATINSDGEVDWNLGTIVLENNVTYTMTFVVWPSQASLNLVADLNNGIIDYDSLTDDQKSQIQVSGGHYSLKTNTDYPSVTYSTVTTTTIDGETSTVVSDPQTVTIQNPDPVGLAESRLNAVKAWDDSLDPSQREEIEDVVLYLLVDGDYYYVDDEGNPMGVTLTEESDWTETDYIAIAPGLMVPEGSPAYDSDATQVTWEGTTYAVLESGHEYVFEESDINNHFELTAYTHHPMIMGSDSEGKPLVKDVIFTTDDAGNITGVESVSNMGDNLSATNTLKPGINIQKKVVDEDGNEITETSDTFEITVYLVDEEGNALPTKKNASGEYTYDYRIYYGPNNPNYDAGSGGGRSGHIYGTGTSFTEDLYVGDVIRVVNVEAGALFRVEETEITGYELTEMKYEISRGSTTGYEEYEDSVALDGETYYATEGNSASQVTLTNTYTSGDLEITKTVEVESGDEDQAKDKEFEFTLKLYSDEDKTEELKDSKYNYTIDGEDAGTISSGGKLVLKDGQTAKVEKLPESAYYEVVETAVKGYASEAEGDTGTIEKNATAEASFVNTYSVTSVIVDPPVQKVLTASDGVTPPDIEGKFTFTIEAVSAKDASGADLDVEIPMPENTSITNSAEYERDDMPGYYEFGEIEYTVPGVYTYTVTETGSVNGVVNDSEQDIVVTVTDDGEGALTFEVNYTDAVVFTNEYTTTEVTVVKEWDDEGFDENRPESVTMTLKGDDEEIGTATLDESNDWTYTWTELPASTTLEDGTIHQIKYTVEEEAVDNYTSTSKTETDETTGDVTWTFTNTVKTVSVELTASKVLVGRSWKEGESFTFTLYDTDGTTVLDTQEVTGDGEVLFKALKLALGTYEYTISETGTLPSGITKSGDITATVTITEDEDGTLAYDIQYTSDGTITNTYEVSEVTVDLSATKVLTGRDLKEGEFSFKLELDDGLVETVANAADGSITFGTLTFDEVGTHTFKVYEVKGNDANVTYDETVYEGVITVSDNGEGALEAVVEGGEDITFTNTYENPEVPDTGDHFNTVGWTIVLLTAGLALAALVLIRIRKRS